MATADTVKNQLQALIDSANAKTGKADGDLTAAVGSLMEGYGIGSDPVLTELTITENGEYTPGEGVDGFSKVLANVAVSGGSGVETGELTTTTSNYYSFTIPVSSKKSHIVIYPKVFEDEAHNSGRISYWLVVEGYAQIEIRKGGGIYMRAADDINTAFTDTSIQFNGGKAPYNVGEYWWYAW